MVLIAKYSNTVTWNLQTKYDSGNIAKMTADLERMGTLIEQNAQKWNNAYNRNGSGIEQSANQAINKILEIQKVLDRSFNRQTNMFNVKELTEGLNNAGFDKFVAQIASAQTGVQGLNVRAVQFCNNLAANVGKINTNYTTLGNTVDKVMNTFGNTVRWGITASVFQTIQNSIYRSVEYLKELDTSLNNIRIVTGYSAEDMKSYADYANQAAQSLGVSTTAFTDAAQLYAQNGYNVEDQQKLAELTIKTANVTQADVTETSEHITALINGYQLSIDEAEKALDGMAKVAAASASDLDELATAQERVASTANMLGVSQEQLTSQISTIVSVTRLAPESVGTALRTLYSRFADLELGETLEDGVNL